MCAECIRLCHISCLFAKTLDTLALMASVVYDNLLDNLLVECSCILVTNTHGYICCIMTDCNVYS